MNMSDAPYRNCKNCEGLGDCPEPFVDLEGTPHCPKYCPKKEEFKEDDVQTETLWNF